MDYKNPLRLKRKSAKKMIQAQQSETIGTKFEEKFLKNKIKTLSSNEEKNYVDLSMKCLCISKEYKHTQNNSYHSRIKIEITNNV